uniref:Uncharacterized protein n=1 Tax=Knipowitschia caucasica TaxID=637954 RepID=A0AAV2MTV2_KNICA
MLWGGLRTREPEVLSSADAEQRGCRAAQMPSSAGAEQHGWKAKIFPVEVGCRGFVGKSTIRLLQDLGIRGDKPTPSQE